ncbi:MAG: hypothetical protein QM569_10430 [Acidovorax sp.]|uniref:hypothetical protein n=1 Tax=Acidovorax sp. TaxID=1872122 RepID=UPI0039E573BD
MRALSPLTCLLVPVLSLAQPAADPGAATAPLNHPALPLPAAPLAPQPWREANEAVAAFPRGHADIVAWEARQRASAQAHEGHDHDHRTAPAKGQP